jgi:acyl-CoA reductase-like NAD-dependent aldehyde dehydrogenase
MLFPVGLPLKPGQRKVPLKERIAILSKFLDAFAAEKDTLAKELTEQMGRCGRSLGLTCMLSRPARKGPYATAEARSQASSSAAST